MNTLHVRNEEFNHIQNNGKYIIVPINQVCLDNYIRFKGYYFGMTLFIPEFIKYVNNYYVSHSYRDVCEFVTTNKINSSIKLVNDDDAIDVDIIDMEVVNIKDINNQYVTRFGVGDMKSAFIDYFDRCNPFNLYKDTNYAIVYKLKNV